MLHKISAKSLNDFGKLLAKIFGLERCKKNINTLILTFLIIFVIIVDWLCRI